MEQLNRKLRHWEYSHERYWRDLKYEITKYLFWFYEKSLLYLKFWISFLVFLKLKTLKHLIRLLRHVIVFFFACVSSRALRLQRQPGEFVLSEDLYRQLNENMNYSPFLRK